MAVRHYQFTLTTEGLLHIGSGEKLGKWDYFLDGNTNGTIAVLDMRKFVKQLSPSALDAYTERLMESRDNNTRFSGQKNEGLQDFLDSNLEARVAAGEAVAYRIAFPLTKSKRGSYGYNEVQTFIKDAYGKPYVPGSSLKGALRTALLVHLIQQNPQEYLWHYISAQDVINQRSKADDRIEQRAFYRANLTGASSNAINDVMRYISVSDSEPLTSEDLCFAKKYDKFPKNYDAGYKRRMGNSSVAKITDGNELNIYRECLKPGTVITCRVDVDECIDRCFPELTLDAKGIAQVLSESYDLYKRCFLDDFPSADDVQHQKSCGVRGRVSNGQTDGHLFESTIEVPAGMCQYVFSSGPLAGRACPNHARRGSRYCGKHQGMEAPHSSSPDGVGGAASAAPCMLGGGVDFDSKTVLNALFEGDDCRLDEIAQILYGQFPSKVSDRNEFLLQLQADIRRAGFQPKPYTPRGKKTKEDHRHWMDSQTGVSPHTMKYGLMGQNPYVMGKCMVSIQEV